MSSYLACVVVTYGALRHIHRPESLDDALIRAARLVRSEGRYCDVQVRAARELWQYVKLAECRRSKGVRG